MKNLVLGLASFMMLSCGGLKPLTTVSSVPLEVVSKKSIEEVWSKLVDKMAIDGVGIKILDKSSGLMMSEEYSFMNSYTKEDKEGNLKNKSAFVVIQNGRPTSILGTWNVRVKSNSKGETIINVNLTNLKAYSYEVTKYGNTYKNFDVKTTQVFEKQLTEYLSN